MRFTCPACSKSYRLTREHLGASGGAKIKCPNCQAVVRVQLGEGETLHAEIGQASGAFPAERASAPPAQLRATGNVASAAPVWHVAVGKAARGPMAVGQIQALIDGGELTLDNLGWRQGMVNWTKLSDIAELRGQIRAALQGPTVDPAGVDPSGNAPTVMADVVVVAEPAAPTPSERHAAATLKPDRSQASAAALPRGRAPAPAPAPQAQASTAKAQSVGAGKAAVAAPAPAATLSPAARTSGGLFPSGGAATGSGSVGHAAQTASFFDAGDSMADMDIALPDPNKHKPTKEEYQNLLQEFSVMFRLDKRSKRQKVAIAVVLSTLLVGVIAFGVILVLQGQQRQALIRDSKTILAVFSLDYQTSVTVNLSREAEEEAAKTGKAVQGGPVGTRTTSRLAEELRSKIKSKRIESASAGPAKRAAPARIAAGGVPTVKRSKEEIEAEARAQEEALRRQLGGVGDRAEKVVGFAGATSQVSKAQLAGMCRASAPDLRGCAETLAGGSSFTAVVHINTAGNVDKVDAMVGGSRDGDLSGCALSKLRNKRFGLQDRETTYNCDVN